MLIDAFPLFLDNTKILEYLNFIYRIPIYVLSILYFNSKCILDTTM